jgi:hypothetical protein
MKLRTISAAGLMLALAGCNTISMPAMPTTNPVSARWVGQSAGRFFASYGPPISDHDDGGGRVYNWRGGYKTVKISGEDAKKGRSAGGRLHLAGDAAKGKAAGGHLRLSCKADITTSSDYVIRSIHITGDMPSGTSGSYCTELLAPAEQAQN